MNALNANGSYLTVEHLTNNINERNWFSIIHVNYRNLLANVTQLKVLLENLEFSFAFLAFTEYLLNYNNALVLTMNRQWICQRQTDT